MDLSEGGKESWSLVAKGIEVDLSTGDGLIDAEGVGDMGRDCGGPSRGPFSDMVSAGRKRTGLVLGD